MRCTSSTEFLFCSLKSCCHVSCSLAEKLNAFSEILWFFHCHDMEKVCIDFLALIGMDINAFSRMLMPQVFKSLDSTMMVLTFISQHQCFQLKLFWYLWNKLMQISTSYLTQAKNLQEEYVMCRILHLKVDYLPE